MRSRTHLLSSVVCYHLLNFACISLQKIDLIKCDVRGQIRFFLTTQYFKCDFDKIVLFTFFYYRFLFRSVRCLFWALNYSNFLMIKLKKLFFFSAGKCYYDWKLKTRHKRHHLNFKTQLQRRQISLIDKLKMSQKETNNYNNHCKKIKRKMKNTQTSIFIF